MEVLDFHTSIFPALRGLVTPIPPPGGPADPKESQYWLALQDEWLLRKAKLENAEEISSIHPLSTAWPPPAMNNPLFQDVRDPREALAAKLHFDSHRIFEDAMKRQAGESSVE